MCPRGESQLTYMIPIAVTAEFCLDGGWCPVSSAVGGRVGRAGVLVAYLVLICCKCRPRRCSPASLRLIAFLRWRYPRAVYRWAAAAQRGYGHTWPCPPAGSGRASITVYRRVGVAGALPDGTPGIISGGRDGTVRVRRTADGTPVGERGVRRMRRREPRDTPRFTGRRATLLVCR